MLQLVKEICKKTDDDTKLALIFANQTEEDILLRDDIDVYAAKYQEQLKVWYTLDRPSPTWKFSTGFISEEMIKEHLYPPSADTITLMCGPPPMVRKLHLNQEFN